MDLARTPRRLLDGVGACARQAHPLTALGFALAYPIGLGLAAGAMIFVVSHEVIPRPIATATGRRPRSA